jgi:Gpi18-like mannosyltransferase
MWHGLTPSPETFYFIWQKWDAIHYLNIIAKGYGPFAAGKLNTAFFPAYPLLCRLVPFVVGSDVLAGLLVSNLAFLGAMILLYKLLRLDYDRVVAERAVLFMAVFPFSLFFSGIYTESLFLLAVLGCFYSARRENWLNVFLWGVLATSTRLVGLALVPAVLYYYYEQRRFKLERTDRHLLGVLAIPSGLGLYMVYQYFAFGSFTSFLRSSGEVWGRKLSFPWVSVLNHMNRMAAGKGFPVFIYNLLVLLLLIFILVEVFRRRQTAYGIFGTAALLLPLMSSTLKAFTRYAIVMFPLYLILSLWAGDSRVERLITVVSILFLGFFLTVMVQWGYLG